MYPTLKSGQFILVDTWAYSDVTPSINDVVIFEHGVEKMHLVKRINLWPNGKLTKKGLWYVMGDNLKFSQDSRYFGGIAIEQISGKVKLVIASIDDKKSGYINFLFSRIH